jgi:hypothetical protein
MIGPENPIIAGALRKRKPLAMAELCPAGAAVALASSQEREAVPVSLILEDGHFVWRQRLRENADTRTLTELHVRIAHHIAGRLADGNDQFSDADVAEALHVDPKTVWEARQRLRGVGLLQWQDQYVAMAGGPRRRTVNRYWLTLPTGETVARPDLRRSGLRTLARARKQVSAQEGGGVWITERDSAARQLRALGFAVPPAWGAFG